MATAATLAATEALRVETPLSEGAGAGESLLLSAPSAALDGAEAREGAGGDESSGEFVSGLVLVLLSSPELSSAGAGAALGGADLAVEEGVGAFALAEGVGGGVEEEEVAALGGGAEAG